MRFTNGSMTTTSANTMRIFFIRSCIFLAATRWAYGSTTCTPDQNPTLWAMNQNAQFYTMDPLHLSNGATLQFDGSSQVAATTATALAWWQGLFYLPAQYTGQTALSYSYLWRFDPHYKTLTKIGQMTVDVSQCDAEPDHGMAYTGFAFNPTTGLLYVWIVDVQEYNCLVTVSTATGAITSYIGKTAYYQTVAPDIQNADGLGMGIVWSSDASLLYQSIPNDAGQTSYIEWDTIGISSSLPETSSLVLTGTYPGGINGPCNPGGSDYAGSGGDTALPAVYGLTLINSTNNVLGTFLCPGDLATTYLFEIAALTGTFNNIGIVGGSAEFGTFYGIAYPPALQNSCQHGGTCSNFTSCSCVVGYSGASCQTEIDECVSSPCLNGATCVDLVNGYSCSCMPGFSGGICQTEIDECASSPCRNGATCADIVNGYSCACAPGFSGGNCQTEIDDCASQPCRSGGTCVDLPNAYYCHYLIVSAATGNWNTGSTWVGGFVPTQYDTAEIVTPNTVTLNCAISGSATIIQSLIMGTTAISVPVLSVNAGCPIVVTNTFTAECSLSSGGCQLVFHSTSDYIVVNGTATISHGKLAITKGQLYLGSGGGNTASAATLMLTSGAAGYGNLNIVAASSESFGGDFYWMSGMITITGTPGSCSLSITTFNFGTGVVIQTQCPLNIFGLDNILPPISIVALNELSSFFLAAVTLSTGTTFTGSLIDQIALQDVTLQDGITFVNPLNIAVNIASSLGYINHGQIESLQTTQGTTLTFTSDLPLFIQSLSMMDTAGLVGGSAAGGITPITVGSATFSIVEVSGYIVLENIALTITKFWQTTPTTNAAYLLYTGSNITSLVDMTIVYPLNNAAGNTPLSFQSDNQLETVTLLPPAPFNFSGQINVPAAAVQIQTCFNANPALTVLPGAVTVQYPDNCDVGCLSNPCQNGATCSGVYPDQFQCLCDTGYNGTLCQLIPHCASYPCANGGTCSALGWDSFQCQCISGYSGVQCQTLIDNCASNPCQNGATCIDLVNDLRCVCPTGYTGAFCAYLYDNCQTNPCFNSNGLGNVVRYGCNVANQGQGMPLISQLFSFDAFGNATFIGDLNSTYLQANQVGFVCMDIIFHNGIPYAAGFINGGSSPLLPGDNIVNVIARVNLTTAALSNEQFPNQLGCVDPNNPTQALSGMTSMDTRFTDNSVWVFTFNDFTSFGCFQRWEFNSSGIFAVEERGGSYTYSNDFGAGFSFSPGADVVYVQNTQYESGTLIFTLDMLSPVDFVTPIKPTLQLNIVNPPAICDPPPNVARARLTSIDVWNDTLSSVLQCNGSTHSFLATTDPQSGNVIVYNELPTETYGLWIGTDGSPPTSGCLNQLNAFTCVCAEGWGGTTCASSACSSQPCQNGGECVTDVNGAWTCLCVPGYSGVICQTNINECTSNPCLNGAECNDQLNAFTCTCPLDYSGVQCQTQVDHCSSSPCRHGGTCVDYIGGFNCTCIRGFNGTLCQLDTCTLIPTYCQNGGTCHLNSDSDPTPYCFCAPPWAGPTCQNNTSDFCGSLNVTCSGNGYCTNCDAPIFNPPGYKCHCSPGFSGSLCQTNINECASNPCTDGATCVDGINSYSCGCVPGYSGTECQTEIDECASAPCQQLGSACIDFVNGFICQCAAGYSGIDCQTNINECASQPCQNIGMCVDQLNGFVCRCTAGYSGLLCQTAVDQCVSHPCANGGTCVDWINSYSCICPAGYSGLQCETNVNECGSGPCKNGGTCVDGTNEFLCQCNTGYSGLQCDTDINECASQPCQNSGACIDLVNEFACTCGAGYSGTSCQTDIDECASSPCQNGGNCTDYVNHYVCTCSVGYSGMRCDTNINECSSTPCQYSGTCIDMVNGFACQCGGGYSGVLCQTEINECVSTPCQNNGSCADITNGFVCYCAVGYSGALCQTEINFCTSTPCQNGGTCMGLVDGLRCICAAGYSGWKCQTDINECGSGPCQNSGTCLDRINGFACSCSPGYSGAECQTDVNECSSIPCQNGGTCVDGINQFQCHCLGGYSGQQCQTLINDCTSQPCANGGTCFDVTNGYRCVCVSGYSGSQCQTDVDECASQPCQRNGTCVDVSNGFLCICPEFFNGSTCQMLVNECASHPCQNQAICHELEGSYSCSCLAGFSGNACQTEIDECASNPCQNNGTCIDAVDGFVCNCTQSIGFNGTLCDTAIPPSTAFHLSQPIVLQNITQSIVASSTTVGIIAAVTYVAVASVLNLGLTAMFATLQFLALI